MKSLGIRSFSATLFSLIALGAATLGVSRQAAAQELVLDGTFTSTNYVSPQPGNAVTASGGQLGYNLNATGWTNTSSGYNFLFVPGTADVTGANGVDGNLKLWGSHNSGLSTLTAPPGGGNFIAADGAYEVGAIQQTITGLTVGQEYTLSFYWGAAQQSGFTGNTTEKWTASLGAQSFNTSTYSLPSHSFSGWMQQSFTYTATSSSEVLSFLATGTPSGEPPFSLLADVSMQATSPSPAPEPSVLQYGAFLLAIPFLARARRMFGKKSQA